MFLDVQSGRFSLFSKSAMTYLGLLDEPVHNYLHNGRVQEAAEAQRS